MNTCKGCAYYRLEIISNARSRHWCYTEPSPILRKEWDWNMRESNDAPQACRHYKKEGE